MTLFHLPVHPTLLHPRTGEPLRAIGLRPDGTPLWPIIGGDGTEPDANDPDPQTTPDPAKKDGGDPDPWATTFEGMTPQQVKEALDNSRKWETRAKGNKEKADQYDALVERITGKKDDQTPSPDDLNASLTAAQQQTRDLAVENAVLRAAGGEGANPVRLVDSMSFMSKVKALDPSADDFGTQVANAVKAQVEADSYFKANTNPAPLPNPQQGNPSEGKHGGVQAGAELYRSSRNRAAATSTT